MLDRLSDGSLPWLERVFLSSSSAMRRFFQATVALAADTTSPASQILTKQKQKEVRQEFRPLCACPVDRLSATDQARLRALHKEFVQLDTALFSLVRGGRRRRRRKKKKKRS